MDFYRISTVYKRDGSVVISPIFVIGPTKDLMIRGRDFYAVWLEEQKRWTTDEFEIYRKIDYDISEEYRKQKEINPNARLVPAYMSDSTSGSVDRWKKYCTKQMSDTYIPLDSKLIFANQEIKREDYATKQLPYKLEDIDTPAWNDLITTLYSPEERHKIEWCIGSIVTGDSKKIQKFLVFYGSAGTGKSTIINIIQMLFDGYWSTFNSASLGTKSDTFALESFKKNPLVAIQHDGDLSKIEDNTRLNSLVSHETMSVNEKFKGLYEMHFHSFLIMGTNSPVRITDANSGIIRRLIDVQPSGEKIPYDRYEHDMENIKFELGGIAKHCADVYLEDPKYYNGYLPIRMMSKTNTLYDFLEENYEKFASDPDGEYPLVQLWTMYKQYVEDSGVPYPLTKQKFKNEISEYFKNFGDVKCSGHGRNYNVFSGFRTEKFDIYGNALPEDRPDDLYSIEFSKQHSILDKMLADQPAQYATKDETPSYKWENVKMTLKDLDTSKLHYVQVPLNHIVIDFDMKDASGNKDFELNLCEASKFPPTYAELSKSGAGIHLHYIYDGDVSKLSSVYEDNIEIKVYTGNSSLRRKLVMCNNLEVAHISSGLPIKERVVMTDKAVIQSEKGLRNMIERNLRKEIHPGTKPSIDFIHTILQDAYDRGMKYDVTDLRPRVISFANGSTHNASYCLKKCKDMKWCSEEPSEAVELGEETPIVFFDCEVFPNLFVICWKVRGVDEIHEMINPGPDDIEKLLQYRLIGFNNRNYDNHLLYACMMGYSNEQLYKLSKQIVSNDSMNAKFAEAYNLSFTDIYDFASAGNKKSLKKFEIELGIHHQELGLDWNKPVPQELWKKVADYCCNDVSATEQTFDYLSADWIARQILADIAGCSVNDTTNTLTKRIIFGNNRHPQSEFHYRNLAEPVFDITEDEHEFLQEVFPEMATITHGDAGSQLPYFPGYKYENGVSTYRGEEIGEGGYVYAEPGVYGNVALLDITSMHPHSLMAEILFGLRFTRVFHDIVYGRVNIKHEEWNLINQLFDGKLTKWVEKVKSGEMRSKDLANALKTAINAVYGLTCARFPNEFRDDRNIDNIVAKRGALFMVDLKHAVQEKGYTVVHIKTDSIKIADATPEIIEFVNDFGKRYGYTFEHEATYDKLCIVNDAVYVAKDASDGHWTATGKQFQVPYVFKTLFTHEELTLSDLTWTFSTKDALYLDMNAGLDDVSEDIIELKEYKNKYKRGEISDTTWESPELLTLRNRVESNQNLQFIGKVGNFIPVNNLAYDDSGELYRQNEEGDLFSPPGAKDYRWMETEVANKKFGETINNYIDMSFFDKLKNDAVKKIEEFAGSETDWFISDESYNPAISSFNTISFK